MREKYGIVHHDGPVMELTTMIGCPVMCTFCPQDNLRDNYGKDIKYMQPMDLITVLAKLPKNTRIDFSGMSEPWANPACTTMLETVIYMGFKVAIYTTLYGMTDPEKVRKILESYPDQVEVIMLHLPDSNGNMKGWKPTTEWMNAFETMIKIQVPCGIGAMTMDKSGVVHEFLHPYVKQLAGWQGHTRADSLDPEQVKGQALSVTPRNEFALTCRSTPFYDRNVLLPNGDVVLCCMDYNLKHVIGNLLKQTYEEMMQGEKLAEIIKMNEAAGFDKCSICKSCENVTRI
jgi:radical SAM protein with 4Fe4S-binding SPASM domain